MKDCDGTDRGKCIEDCNCVEFAPTGAEKITCLCSHHAGRHEKSQGKHKDFLLDYY